MQKNEILDAGWYEYQEITKLFDEGKIRDDWIYDAISEVFSNEKD